MAGYDLSTDRLYGHAKARKAARSSSPSAVTCARRTQLMCGARSCWTTSAHACRPGPTPWVGEWAAAHNVELAYVPFYGSWLNRVEAQFTALRYFALDGTDHESHRKQASMIRRYIAWRDGHLTDPRLRKIIRRAETIERTKVA